MPPKIRDLVADLERAGFIIVVAKAVTAILCIQA
jgi:hypothetical protein